jgi:hypothetical protein
MVRPVYSHELTDPDFAWLITTFNEEFPGYLLVDNPGGAVVFIKLSEPNQSQPPEPKPQEAQKKL